MQEKPGASAAASPEILATAEELQEATAYYASKLPATTEGLAAAWVDWFRKRAAKILKDAAARGEYRVSLPLPYQPLTRVERDSLRQLRSQVGAMLPGCYLEFVGAAYEGEQYLWELEISWDPKKGSEGAFIGGENSKESPDASDPPLVGSSPGTPADTERDMCESRGVYSGSERESNGLPLLGSAQ